MQWFGSSLKCLWKWSSVSRFTPWFCIGNDGHLHEPNLFPGAPLHSTDRFYTCCEVLFLMRFWCLSTSSYHPVQFQAIIGNVVIYIQLAQIMWTIFYVNFNMHIHCSLPSWTILVREACGHHWCLRSFFSQMKSYWWVVGFVALWSAVVQIATHCPLFFLIFLLLCSSSSDFDSFVLLGTILCIFQEMFNPSAHLHSAQLDFADHFLC